MTGTNDLIQLPFYTPGTPEWVEQRRRSVGGSEIAPILGIGKWESRFSLWHRKQGTIAPQDDNPGMEWGRRLEDVIAGKYRDDHPDRPMLPGGTWTRTDRPWQIASPDRLLGDRAMLEVKTDHQLDGWGEPGSDEIPVYYRAQVIWYLDVLGRDWCDVAVLINGSDYREYRVHHAADEAAYMRGEAEAFIASITANERPALDQHDATYQAVRELHPDIAGVDVDLPDDLARTYCTARHALKAADDEAKRQRALVADFMGDAQYAKYAGRTIARRQAKKGGTPFVVAADDLPIFDTDPKAA